MIQSSCCVCLHSVCYSRIIGGGYMRNQILTSKYIGSMLLPNSKWVFLHYLPPEGSYTFVIRSVCFSFHSQAN